MTPGRRRAARAAGVRPGLLAAALAIALALDSKTQAQQGDAPSMPFAPQDRPVLASPLPETQGWRFVGVPKQPPTRFARVESDGAPALRIEANASYGNLVHDFAAPLAPGVLAWQWRVDAANAAADLAQRDGDDTNIKVCALFDMPIERVPFVERQLLRLARSVSGEPLPAATVCYVWDPKRTADAALPNAYSPRVRYLVLRGDDAPLMQWVGEQRDLAADFRRLFGDESGEVPTLAALAVGADADNTRGRSVALLRGLRWAGPLAR